jgi:hypothetical protein
VIHWGIQRNRIVASECTNEGRESLVVTWLGMGVAKMLRMNASEPMVGWKGGHPQSVGWLHLVLDKYSLLPVY